MPGPQLADLTDLATGRRTLEFPDVDRIGERAAELFGIEPVAFVGTLGALRRLALRSALRTIKPGIHPPDFTPVLVFFGALDAALNGRAPYGGLVLERRDRNRDDGSDRALRLRPGAAHRKRVQGDLPDMLGSAGRGNYDEEFFVRIGAFFHTRRRIRVGISCDYRRCGCRRQDAR